MSHTRVLGIDPGLATIGFAILDRRPDRTLALESYGVIRTAPGKSLGERLVEVRADLIALIDQYRPAMAAVEQIYFNTNQRTAQVVCQTRGVLLLALAERSIATWDYTPQAVKMAVAGYGRCPKRQVQEMLVKTLSLPQLPRPDDAADAVAVALCHHYTLHGG